MFRKSGKLIKTFEGGFKLFSKNYCVVKGQDKKGQSTKNFIACERKKYVDGIHLNVREEGDGDHNVLCLPGLVGTIETDFGKIFQEMNKKKFRFVCWDPSGFGKSRPPNRNYTPDYYLDDAKLVARLMEVLGYKKYSILGWSNGGMTGYTLAAEFPERVSHLVMWGAHAYVDEEGLGRGLKLCDTKTWSPQMLKTMTGIYGNDYLESMLADWEKCVNEHWTSGKHEVLKERVLKVQCPTLILHAKKDPVLSIKHAHYFVQRIKDSKVRLVESKNHNFHLTNTRDFLRDVETFLLSSPKTVTA